MPTTQTSPQAAPIRDRVARVLNLIRPAVQSDGGDVELVDVTAEGVVRIRLHGACVGCPSSTMTLQVGIERNLKEHVPEVTAVQAVA
jgi:Fe-S cluster biogenesis protein NfuA